MGVGAGECRADGRAVDDGGGVGRWLLFCAGGRKGIGAGVSMAVGLRLGGGVSEPICVLRDFARGVHARDEDTFRSASGTGGCGPSALVGGLRRCQRLDVRAARPVVRNGNGFRDALRKDGDAANCVDAVLFRAGRCAGLLLDWP